MKKWLVLSFIALFCLVTGSLYYSYQTIHDPLQSEQVRVLKYVKDKGEFEVVEEVSFYHGSESYHVIKGKDESGESMIQWVSEDLETAATKREDEGWTLEEVHTYIDDQLDLKKLIAVRLGIEKSIPVYEVTFIDKDNRYTFYYLTFVNGEFMKRYSLKNDLS